jgi:CBS domain-containing protein
MVDSGRLERRVGPPGRTTRTAPGAAKEAVMPGSDPFGPPEMSDADILEAMRDMDGYVDITPETFREIYGYAYAHAQDRLARGVTAREIMTAPVLCLGLDMTAPEAARLLAERGVTGAPVADAAGVVCGVVSEKDFLRHMGVAGEPSFLGVVARCLGTPGCLASELREIGVAELMTAPAVTAPPEVTVREISALFLEKSINRLPICDANGRPLGIVTRTDLVRAFPGGR